MTHHKTVLVSHPPYIYRNAANEADWVSKRGFAEFDETSHMDVQRPWSGDHLDRIVDPTGKKVMFDSDRPRLPKPDDPGNWMTGDKVLLDHNNNPVKAWTDLNKTLSTEIEDWRLEAIRRLYYWLTTAEYAKLQDEICMTANTQAQHLGSDAAFSSED